jgi:hypothetical protein
MEQLLRDRRLAGNWQAEPTLSVVTSPNVCKPRRPTLKMTDPRQSLQQTGTPWSRRTPTTSLRILRRPHITRRPALEDRAVSSGGQATNRTRGAANVAKHVTGAITSPAPYSREFGFLRFPDRPVELFTWFETPDGRRLPASGNSKIYGFVSNLHRSNWIDH